MKDSQKIGSKEILKRAKERIGSRTRKNCTFRFLKDVVEPFQQKCDEKKISMTKVIEEFMRSFVKN